MKQIFNFLFFTMIVLLICLGISTALYIHAEHALYTKKYVNRVIDSTANADDSVLNATIMEQCQEAQAVGIEFGMDTDITKAGKDSLIMLLRHEGCYADSTLSKNHKM